MSLLAIGASLLLPVAGSAISKIVVTAASGWLKNQTVPSSKGSGKHPGDSFQASARADMVSSILPQRSGSGNIASQSLPATYLNSAMNAYQAQAYYGAKTLL